MSIFMVKQCNTTVKELHFYSISPDFVTNCGNYDIMHAELSD